MTRPVLSNPEHSPGTAPAGPETARSPRLTGAGRRVDARVLSFLDAAQAPAGAYDILAGLGAEGITAPQTIYRSLQRLVQSGAVHRLATLNAFAPCTCQGHVGVPVFMICNVCGRVQEFDQPALKDGVFALARDARFRAQTPVIEVHGRCRQCETQPS